MFSEPGRFHQTQPSQTQRIANSRKVSREVPTRAAAKPATVVITIDAA